MYEISVYLHHLETMNNLSILNFPEVEVGCYCWIR